MIKLDKIINAIGEDWKVDTSKCTLKQKEISEIALEKIEDHSVQDSNSWYGWGANIIYQGLTTTKKFLEDLDSTGFEKEITIEDLQKELEVHIQELKKINNSPENYDTVEICKVLIKHLSEYKKLIEKKYENSKQFKKIDLILEDLNTILEINKQNKIFNEETSLENEMISWAKSVDQATTHSLESLAAIASKLGTEQQGILHAIKNEISHILPSNGSLFSQLEQDLIDTIKQKLKNKVKLSEYEIKNLLEFTDRQIKFEYSLKEILQDNLIYENGFLTKNFISIAGATIAGMIGGPGAAFAAHTLVGSLWDNYASDGKPQSRTEQAAGMLMNGVLGAAVGGIGGAISFTASQAIQDEAPTVVRDGITAASIGFLTYSTGVSPALSLKIGLTGLLALKGKQLLQTIKNDLKTVYTVIKDPKKISSSLSRFTATIFKDMFNAMNEKKWKKVFSYTSVIGLSLTTLALGASIFTGIAVQTAGTYLVNRIFHTPDTYKGSATFANPDFREWTVRQHALIEDVEDQLDSLLEIVKHEINKFDNTNKSQKVSEVMNKLLDINSNQNPMILE